MTGQDIQQAVSQFEARRAGDSAALLRTPLPPPSRPDRAPLVAELIRADMAFGWDQGRPRRLTEYLIDFPELLGDSDALARLAREEFRHRSEAGDAPDPAEYALHFGVDLADADVGGATVRLADESTSTGVPHYPRPGDDFAGFRIEAELGRGAFARVYLARQAGLAGRPVALKVTATPSAESQTLARLQHPHIVPIYSVHRERGLYAVCMPYLGSTTLADVAGALSRTPRLPGSGNYFVSTLASRRPPSSLPSGAGPTAALAELPADEARPGEALARLARASYVEAVLWLVGRLADGLAHAHARGVVHRDLKPANILLTNDGQPMLLDFNLADTAGSASHAGGTLPYMAPEHLLAYCGQPGGAVDARSDIYALGLIAYELLAGVAPFPTPAARAAVAVPRMVAARMAGAPDVRRANPAVTPAAAAILAKCLAPRPDDRYPTALALRDDIDAHLGHRPLALAANPSPRENARKWVRRHPRAALAGPLAAAAGLVLIAVVLVAWVARGRAADADARDAARQFVERSDRYVTRRAVETDRGELADAAAEGRVLLADCGANRLARLGESDRRAVARSARAALFVAHRAAARVGLPYAGPLAAALAAAPPGDGPQGRAGRLAEEAVACLDRGDPGAARPALDEAVALAPDWSPGHFLRGVCLRHSGDSQAAIEEFGAARARDPRDAVVLEYRAGSYQATHRYREAVADLSELLANRPGDARLLTERGYCRAMAKDPAEAIADFDAALATGAAPSRAIYFRSTALKKLGRTGDASAGLVKFLLAPPTDAADFRHRGLARRRTDPAGAVVDLREALARDPEQAEAASVLARVLSDDLGRHAEAVAECEQYLAGPRNQSQLALRAVYRARAGDRAGAHRDAEAARAADPKPLTTYRAAAVYALTSHRVPADRATAVALLAAAVAADSTLAARVATDPDFAALSGRARP